MREAYYTNGQPVRLLMMVQATGRHMDGQCAFVFLYVCLSPYMFVSLILCCHSGRAVEGANPTDIRHYTASLHFPDSLANWLGHMIQF